MQFAQDNHHFDLFFDAEDGLKWTHMGKWAFCGPESKQEQANSTDTAQDNSRASGFWLHETIL
jgi:hypothetical protein